MGFPYISVVVPANHSSGRRKRNADHTIPTTATAMNENASHVNIYIYAYAKRFK